MNKILPPEQLRELSVLDRLELLDDVWASLAERPDLVPVPDWHRDVLDARIERQSRHPEEAERWDQAKANITASLKK